MEKTCSWRPLTEADLPRLLDFCRANDQYYAYIRCAPDAENLREQLTVQPPNTHPEQKHFLGLWEKGQLSAILDLILDWPRSGVAYVGWFMVARELQRTGLGRRLEGQLCARLKTKGYHTLRLACVEDNLPALAFWRGCGFVPTGERVDRGDYTLVLLEKNLAI